ncbi:MAG: hypothetical protein LBB74_06440 [Chitinispirillales bacterium]|jgi:hypothetical protein|nr:hypothetical protein [Chitinispirillales bacterium]
MNPQQQLLTEILDKTTHIRGGLAAKDIDIVDGALSERGELISAYIRANFGPPAGECAALTSKISEMDLENNRVLKAMMDECSEGLFEARRKIKELQTGKKAAGQYHGAAQSNSGAVFDFKR